MRHALAWLILRHHICWAGFFANYARFRTVRTRDAGGDAVALKEIYFYDPGQNHVDLSSATITNPGGFDGGNNHPPAFAIDKDDATKWYDMNRADLIVSLPSLTEISYFGLKLAEDWSGRDPINFEVLLSQDGTNWALVYYNSDAAAVPDIRNHEAFHFELAAQWRALLFQPMAMRTSGGSWRIQVSELEFWDAAATPAKIDLGAASAVATSFENAGSSPSGQEPAKAIDADYTTSWAELSEGAGLQVYLPWAPVTVSSWSWATAGDLPENDPVRWNLYGLYIETGNNNMYLLNQQQADFAVPLTREASIGSLSIDTVLADTTTTSTTSLSTSSTASMTSTTSTRSSSTSATTSSTSHTTTSSSSTSTSSSSTLSTSTSSTSASTSSTRTSSTSVSTSSSTGTASSTSSITTSSTPSTTATAPTSTSSTSSRTRPTTTSTTSEPISTSTVTSTSTVSSLSTLSLSSSTTLTSSMSTSTSSVSSSTSVASGTSITVTTVSAPSTSSSSSQTGLTTATSSVTATTTTHTLAALNTTSSTTGTTLAATATVTTTDAPVANSTSTAATVTETAAPASIPNLEQRQEAEIDGFFMPAVNASRSSPEAFGVVTSQSILSAGAQVDTFLLRAGPYENARGSIRVTSGSVEAKVSTSMFESEAFPEYLVVSLARLKPGEELVGLLNSTASGEVLATQPVSIKVHLAEREINGTLPTPLEITFVVVNGTDPGDLECVFWDEQLDDWSTSGVSTLAPSSGIVRCATTHLSIFAAIFREVLKTLVCSNAAAIFSLEGLRSLLRWQWATRPPALVLWSSFLLGGVLLAISRWMDLGQMERIDALQGFQHIRNMRPAGSRKDFVKALKEHFLGVLHPSKRVASQLLKRKIGLDVGELNQLCRVGGMTGWHKQAKAILSRFADQKLVWKLVFLYQVHCKWFSFITPSLKASCSQRCSVLFGKLHGGWAIMALFYGSTALAPGDPECSPPEALFEKLVRSAVVAWISAFFGTLPLIALLSVIHLGGESWRATRARLFWYGMFAYELFCAMVISIFIASVSAADGEKFLLSSLTNLFTSLLLQPVVLTLVFGTGLMFKTDLHQFTDWPEEDPFEVRVAKLSLPVDELKTTLHLDPHLAVTVVTEVFGDPEGAITLAKDEKEHLWSSPKSLCPSSSQVLMITVVTVGLRHRRTHAFHAALLGSDIGRGFAGPVPLVPAGKKASCGEAHVEICSVVRHKEDGQEAGRRPSVGQSKEAVTLEIVPPMTAHEVPVSQEADESREEPRSEAPLLASVALRPAPETQLGRHDVAEKPSSAAPEAELSPTRHDVAEKPSSAAPEAELSPTRRAAPPQEEVSLPRREAETTAPAPPEQDVSEGRRETETMATPSRREHSTSRTAADWSAQEGPRPPAVRLRPALKRPGPARQEDAKTPAATAVPEESARREPREFSAAPERADLPARPAAPKSEAPVRSKPPAMERQETTVSKYSNRT